MTEAPDFRGFFFLHWQSLADPGSALADLTKLRSSKYLNNPIEQDHRNVKSRLGLMPGMKSCMSAATTVRGIELMHRIRKGQFDLRSLSTQEKIRPKSAQAVLAA